MTSIANYEQLKKFYKNFQKNLPKDEFTRYYKEYSFAKSLIEFAKNQKLDKDVLEYEKVQKNAMEKLKKLGYKLV